jgi:hypothetical protein
MTANTKDTFTIYNEQFITGYTETLVMETNIFNAASRGAITLQKTNKLGDYAKETIFDLVSNITGRRDISSLATANDKDLTTSEIVDVKLNRKHGPVKKTLDALKKIGKDPAEFSFILGQQVAKAVLVDQVNSALAAVTAALSGVASILYDGSAASMTHTALAYGAGKFGDQSTRIALWVMHSVPKTALGVLAISEKITNVADGMINFGVVGANGLPVLMVDSPSLLVAGTPQLYATVGLVAGAVRVIESEDPTMILAGPLTGYENLVYRMQGESAFNLGVKGFTWNVQSGGANPTDAAVATQSNWDQSATSYKDLAGVYIKSR